MSESTRNHPKKKNSHGDEKNKKDSLSSPRSKNDVEQKEEGGQKERRGSDVFHQAGAALKNSVSSAMSRAKSKSPANATKSKSSPREDTHSELSEGEQRSLGTPRKLHSKTKKKKEEAPADDDNDNAKHADLSESYSDDEEKARRARRLKDEDEKPREKSKKMESRFSRSGDVPGAMSLRTNNVDVKDVAGTIALEQFTRALRGSEGALSVRARVAGFLRFSKSFDAHGFYTWTQERFGWPIDVARKVLLAMEESKYARRLTGNSVPENELCTKQTQVLFRLNIDEKSKHQRPMDREKLAEFSQLLVNLFPTGVPPPHERGSRIKHNTSGGDSPDIEAARLALQARIRAKPLTSPHLLSLELMKDMRQDESLGAYVPTIDYVVGVLSAGDAYRPNFNLSFNDADDAAELKSFLMDYSGGAKSVHAPQSSEARERRSVVKAALAADDDHEPSSDQIDAELDFVTRKLFRDLKKWTFDVFEFNKKTNGRPLYFIGLTLFKYHGLIDAFDIPEETLKSFLNAVENGYRDNLYHNKIHAADVTQSVNFFLTTGGLGELLTPLELMAMILAALVHDLDHVGFNNAFLINTEDPLALLHNDKSVLENHHIHQTYTLLRNKEHNFLCNVEKAQLKELREMIIELILDTDFSKHFDLLGQFKAKHTSETGLDMEKKAEKLLLLGIALKCADVGHTAKAHALHLAWTERITGEFFLQGDEEKRRNLPVSPFMDRETTVIAKSQTGFIEFLVLPLYQLWVDQFQSAQICLDNVQANLAYWQEVAAQGEEETANKRKKHKHRRVASTKDGSESNSSKKKGSSSESRRQTGSTDDSKRVKKSSLSVKKSSTSESRSGGNSSGTNPLPRRSKSSEKL